MILKFEPTHAPISIGVPYYHLATPQLCKQCKFNDFKIRTYTCPDFNRGALLPLGYAPNISQIQYFHALFSATFNSVPSFIKLKKFFLVIFLKLPQSIYLLPFDFKILALALIIR